MGQGDAEKFVVRTVLDLRPATSKYVFQTMLLVASWHRHASPNADLEVLTIGDANPVLSGFLASMGVRCERILPGANDDFSKNGNKIEGARPDAAGRRVLLLDNDTCFLGGLSDLARIPVDAIAAAEAGNARIEDDCWRLIRETIGLPLLRRRWVPLNQRLAPGEHDGPVLRERWLYLNSGAILLPALLDLRPTWYSHQRAINDFFRGHARITDAVTTSDQAGFASSVAAHGKFAWLPQRFNYRPPCFCLGLEPAANLRILHFTNDIDDAGHAGIAARVENYWRQRILRRIDALPKALPAPEGEWRRAQAMDALAMIKAIVHEYDLDGLASALSRSRGAGVPLQ